MLHVYWPGRDPLPSVSAPHGQESRAIRAGRPGVGPREKKVDSEELIHELIAGAPKKVLVIHGNSQEFILFLVEFSNSSTTNSTSSTTSTTSTTSTF